MSISKRIRELRKLKNLNQVEIAEALGVAQSTISQYEAGKRTPECDVLEKIKRIYGINLNWLVSGDGAMFHIYDTSARGVGDVIRLPVVADIAAGKGIEAEDVEPVEWLPVCRSLIDVPGPYFAFRVSGESMSPYIMDGDYAVVSQNMEDVDPDGLICAFRTIEGMTLKRYTINSTRDFSALVPLNPKYPSIPYDENSPEYVIVGRLVLIIRKCIGGE